MVDILSRLGYNNTMKNLEDNEMHDDNWINVFKRTSDNWYPSYQLYSGKGGTDDEARNVNDLMPKEYRTRLTQKASETMNILGNKIEFI